MDWYFVVLLSATSALLAGYALRRAMRWAGERGWVYNTYNPRPPGAGTSGQVAQIFQPAIEHVVDEQKSQRILATQWSVAQLIVGSLQVSTPLAASSVLGAPHEVRLRRVSLPDDAEPSETP
ncbi:MAG TPA: hypothetical protein ENG94_07075 [Actinobacteria bacterium]|nr:hypothetical protein [Actinomycetota bacterium]